MVVGDEYRLKAAECAAHAKRETNPVNRAEWEAMARSYLRLAEQANRDSLTDAVYEPQPEQTNAQQLQAQQQQQQQSKQKPEK